MRGLRILVALALVVATLPLRAAPAAAATLPSQLDALASSFAGQAGVWIGDPLLPDPLYAQNADTPVVTASLYKLGVLAEAERLVDAGKLHYSDTIQIDPEDITADGSFEAPGDVLTLDQALEAMITVSDNGTAMHLWRMLGPANIDDTLAKNGIKGFHVALSEDEDNTATPRAIGTYFTLLAKGKLVSSAASQRMLRRLERQQINDRIPSQLPEGTIVAHKTGNLAGLVHDAGIVFTPRGARVVVGMTWDADEGVADDFIAHLASTVYAAALLPPASPRYTLPFLDGGAFYAERGATLVVPVQVQNAGDAAWTLGGDGRMGLGWELRDAKDAVLSRSSQPLALGNVAPGAAVTLPLVVPMPGQPGDAKLVLGLVDAAGRQLSGYGVATVTVPVRVHLPFVVEPVIRIPRELHRGEASMIEVDYTALDPVRAEDHSLALSWRLIHDPTNRVVARGTVPLGVMKTYERAGSFFAPLVAPNMRGSYVLEYEIREGGYVASVTQQETVEVGQRRTYGDQGGPVARPRGPIASHGASGLR
ncbi:MAG: serine hydrolase [Chloroflexota bacterium]|nr:serine hydrolase [Chloroflexota bacterium]